MWYNNTWLGVCVMNGEKPISCCILCTVHVHLGGLPTTPAPNTSVRCFVSRAYQVSAIDGVCRIHSSSRHPHPSLSPLNYWYRTNRNRFWPLFRDGNVWGTTLTRAAMKTKRVWNHIHVRLAAHTHMDDSGVYCCVAHTRALRLIQS